MPENGIEMKVDMEATGSTGSALAAFARAALGFLVARRRGILSLASLLVFIALFPGSALRPVSAPSSSMGGASFPVSVEARPAEQSDRGLFYSVYKVAKGDTIGDISESHGITTDSIISFNDIRNARGLQPGTLLKVPSQSGILYDVREGDSLEGLAKDYGISSDSIVEANGLMTPVLAAGRSLFLPDARLPSFKLREINGDLFRWPVAGDISSRYGWRSDPFGSGRTFHNGLDIATWQGRAVRAAMEGRVSDTGYSPAFGNYILIAHHSGYASFYGHLSAISVKSGQAVALGQTIGAVGNTGYSTGPHLHFTVFKYGSTVNPANLLH